MSNLKLLTLLIKKIQIELEIAKIKLQLLLRLKKEFVVVHHSAGNGDFQSVNEWHKIKWGMKSSLGFYCGYHKFISPDGTLIVARLDKEEGAHCVEPGKPHYWNRNSIGICLQGCWNKTLPTKPQLDTLKKELNQYAQKGYKLKAHREISKTFCPGNALYSWLCENYERYDDKP